MVFIMSTKNEINIDDLVKCVKFVKNFESWNDVAEYLDVTGAALSNWRSRNTQSAVEKILKAIEADEDSAKIFSLHNFLGNHFPLENGVSVSYKGRGGVPGFVKVRKILTRLSAGPGTFVFDEGDDGIGYYFREDWLRRWCNPDDALMFDVDGISSEPLIRSTDSVLMNRACREIIEGEFYAIRHGDVLKLKQLSWQLDGRIEVRSFNPDADEKPVIANPDEIEILGQVFWRCGLVGRAGRR